MKQLGPGQHKTSSSLVAYVQDGLDLDELENRCSISSAILQYITSSKV